MRTSTMAAVVVAGTGCGGVTGCALEGQTGNTTVDPVVFEAVDRAPREPKAQFPVRLAIARLGYAEGQKEEDEEGNGDEGTGSSRGVRLRKTPESSRTWEVEQFARKANAIRDAVVLQPGMTARITSPPALLKAARRYDAAVVLTYSVSTVCDTNTPLPLASVFTLGFLPNVTAETEATGRAAFIDARSGRVYHRFRYRHSDWQLANVYSKSAAEEATAEKAIDRVVRSLMDRARNTWPNVKAQLADASGSRDRNQSAASSAE